MIRLGRRLGVAGFLLSVGLACTQLMGGDRENTLAPVTPRPSLGGMLNPVAPPAEGTSCGLGQFQCNGALLQACADDQKSWITVQRCAAAALCQADPATCLAATCGTDEMTCVGAVLQKCNADRTGWDVFATCASPAHCNADRRSCMPEACNPGDRRCDRSELDQSPVLETCTADRTDWQQLDACVTRELCNETLTTALAGGIVIGSDGIPQVQGPTTTAEVIDCLLPKCAVGEVRCEGSQLQYCSEGRTGFVTAEECASSALCQGSLMNFTPSGVPACLPPVCATGEHQCTEAGVLQVCNEDRTGFRVIQACIGPAFCNAALANQGQDGCTAAPCEAGHMQCNGAEIQKCRDDRTGLDDTGTVCESAALCNAADPLNAFCEEPTCRRGATSGSEFRCDGAALQRCNESLTGFDTIETCLNAALCDASQRFDGCLEPDCQPGDFACSEGFLQACNADQTGFENIENCGSQAACDANAGRCADPCEPGAVRCNNTSGDLEECVDPLLGWQTIGDCVSLPLCDAENRTCRDPVCPAAGQRRCETRGQNPVVTQCSIGRDRFDVVTTCDVGEICDAQNNECDICQPNSRRCEGGTLVVCDARGQTETRTPCASGCATVAGQTRCLACGPDGSARCGNNQLFVCQQSPTGEFEQSEFCETNELCQQTLQTCGRGLQGQDCQCNDGVCRPNQLRCFGNALQRCNAGLTDFDFVVNCGEGLCNAATGDCNTCLANQFSCNNGSLRQCAFDGRSFARTNIQSGTECVNGNQVRVCNGATATTQNCPNGCTNGRGCNQCTGNGVQCINGNTIRRCVNGFFQDQFCAQGCNAGATQCNNCTGNATSCINGTTQQQCVNGQFVNTNCPLGCVAGRCAACNTGQCTGDNFRACTNGQLAAAVACPDTDRNPCAGGACNPATGCTIGPEPRGFSCSDGNACNGAETCDGTGFCNSGTPLSCASPGECQQSSCNGSTGRCETSNLVNGTACGFGTTAGTCQNGTCVAGCNPPCGGATPFCAGQRCIQCRTAADCPGPTGADAQCRQAACAGGSCTFADRVGTCNDGNPCNGPDACSGRTCAPTTPGFQQNFCPNNIDTTCLARFGCQIVGGAANCLREVSPVGTSCNTASGAIGTCNGTSFGAAACRPIIIQ
jgi:hypothetical protein